MRIEPIEGYLSEVQKKEAALRKEQAIKQKEAQKMKKIREKEEKKTNRSYMH